MKKSSVGRRRRRDGGGGGGRRRGASPGIFRCGRPETTDLCQLSPTRRHKRHCDSQQQRHSGSRKLINQSLKRNATQHECRQSHRQSTRKISVEIKRRRLFSFFLSFTKQTIRAVRRMGTQWASSGTKDRIFIKEKRKKEDEDGDDDDEWDDDSSNVE